MKPKSAVRFTETLSGHLSFGEHDPVSGAAKGVAERNKVLCRLTVHVGDADHFHLPPHPENAVTGWAYSSALGKRLPIEKGSLRFFVSEGDAGTAELRYRLLLRDDVGHPLIVIGTKTVGGPRLSRLWRDATTVRFQMLSGHDSVDGTWGEGEVLAAGVIKITPRAFLAQLMTFRAANLRAILRFTSRFSGRLLRAYRRGR